MTGLPKISIITPSFNQGQYIEQTILSVLTQDYPNLEYIVIDGGSTDNTLDILKKYNDRITYWVSEPDKGQTEALNKGYRLVTGDIINWINSDDYYAHDSLNKIADSFEDTTIKAVTTIVHNFDEEGAGWDESTSRLGSNVDYIAKSFNNQPGTFFRKEIWDRYFPLPEQLRYTMDQYLWFCFWMEHGNEAFKIETYSTVFFRRHAFSKTSSSLTDTIFNHLGQVFFNEHNLIFWSFFVEADPNKAFVLTSYFQESFDYKSKKVCFPINLIVDKLQVEKLFQLYLFCLLNEDFRLGFFDRLKMNLKYLNTRYFTDAESKLIRRMYLCTISPKAFKAYRSIYWKLKQRMNKA